MAYDALSVANAFLKIAKNKKEKLSPLKLQKLVYFAHGWYLALKDEPLINEQIDAWQYGPVIPSIYHEFKEFGKSPIDRLAKRVTICDLENNSGSTIKVEIPSLPDDEFVEALLDKVWELYGKYSAIQLSNITHLPDTPWAETWKEGSLRGTDISKELIRDYFKKKIAE
jgi:uncharacterized phage-associated protein